MLVRKLLIIIENIIILEGAVIKCDVFIFSGIVLETVDGQAFAEDVVGADEEHVQVLQIGVHGALVQLVGISD